MVHSGKEMLHSLAYILSVKDEHWKISLDALQSALYAKKFSDISVEKTN